MRKSQGHKVMGSHIPRAMEPGGGHRGKGLRVVKGHEGFTGSGSHKVMCPVVLGRGVTLMDRNSVSRGRKTVSSLSHTCFPLPSMRPRSFQR